MAQSDIAEILNLIKTGNEDNAEAWSKILTSIDTKFESIASDSDAAGLIRESVLEFKQALTEKQEHADSKFAKLEEALNSISVKEEPVEFGPVLESLSEIKSDFGFHMDTAISAVSEIKDEVFGMQGEINSKLENVFDSFSDAKSEIISYFDTVSDAKNEIMSRFDSAIVEESKNQKELISKKFKNIETSNKDLQKTISDINAKVCSISENTWVQEVKDQLGSVRSQAEGILNSLSAFEIKNNEIANVLENLADRDNFEELNAVTNSITEKISTLSSQLQDSLSEVAQKIDNAPQYDHDAMKVELLQGGVNNAASIIGSFNELNNKTIESIQEFEKNNNISFEELEKSINDIFVKVSSGNVEKIGSKIETISDNLRNSLRDYISELEEVLKSGASDNTRNILENITGIEKILGDNSKDYEKKFTKLKEKISDYVENVEKASQNTDVKIEKSFTEISEIKSDLVGLLEALKSENVNTDEKLVEVISNISDINNSIDEIKNNTLQEDLTTLSVKFDKVLSDIEVYNTDRSKETKEAVDRLFKKISTIKQDIGNINTDMSEALTKKYQDMVGGFEPIKTEISEFFETNFERVVEGLKTQIEFSYLNACSDFQNGVNQNQQAIEGLGSIYQETLDKITSMEECVVEQTQNSLELLRLAIDSACKNIDLSANKTDMVLAEWQQGMEFLRESVSRLNEYSGSIESLRGEVRDLFANKFDVRINDLSAKLDELKWEYSQNSGNQNSDLMQELSAKVDILADSEALEISLEDLHEKVDELMDSDGHIAETLKVLHDKVNDLSNNEDDFDLRFEIANIKELITNQRQFFIEAQQSEKAAVLDNCLGDLQNKIDEIESSAYSGQIASDELRESVLTAIASVFEQISFVEEAEEIKDFVEEKTDEINFHLQAVTDQLKKIATVDEDGYSYTLQDVESDIAKVRMALNNISNSTTEDTLASLSDNINKITSSMEGLQSNLTQEQMSGLKSDFENINSEILSLSTRTNKLLLNSDESYQALSDGLNQFSNVIYQLEQRMNFFDNTEINERLERKLDELNKLALSGANADKVFHQVLSYLGEWIDSTTEKISGINQKTSEIDDLKQTIRELKESIPDKAYVFSEIEDKFEQQELRLDRLEMKIEKIMSVLEDRGEAALNEKMEKIENQMARLSLNVEKLVSYVD